MTMALTRPVSSDEARAFRAAEQWADDVPVHLGTLRAHLERTALVDRGGAMTYTELAAAVERVASALHGVGVGPGDAVVMVTDNEHESVVACHTVWRLGAVALLVHKSSGAADVECACRASSPKVVLLAPAAEPLRAAAAPHGRGVHAIADLLAAGGAPPPPVPVDADAARLVICHCCIGR